MSKIRMRYLVGAAATAAVAATAVIASPAGAVSVPSFQRIQVTAKDGIITANCFFQVTYVSLVNGTVTGNMNGQAQSANLYKSLGVKATEINCTLSNSAGNHVAVQSSHGGGATQTGVHPVTLPLAAHYTLTVTAAQQNLLGGGDVVANSYTTP